MNLLKRLAFWRARTGAARRPSTQKGPSGRKSRRRVCRLETMEQRQLLSVAPIEVGTVYFENATEWDESGDLFEVTFQGGAPGTQLVELRIDCDKLGDGLTIGDVLFDTEPTGIGAFGAVGWSVVELSGIDSVTATVDDGGTLMVLHFTGFEAGDRIKFSIDVDEQGFLGPNAVAEGNEMEGSILTAVFTAPHYYEASGSDIFYDYYDSRLAASGLDLPPDSYVPPGDTPRPVHTAGAFLSIEQTPLPVAIAGAVYEDFDLDNRRDSGEPGIAGVQLVLWQLAGDQYVATGRTTTTDSAGNFRFDGLLPGVYQVAESQPAGYYSVGAQEGAVAGAPAGRVLSPDLITQIDLAGGQESVGNLFAEARPAALSGHVYHDANDNGLLESGETGIAGAVLHLVYLGPLGGGTPVEAVTGADGAWAATGLLPGAYRVLQVQPAGYLDGKDAAGTAGGTAQNPGDRIDGIWLPSGAAGAEYNFGELLPGSIAGRVIADRNANCVYDPGEPLLAGVTIYLLNAAGTRIAQTQTDAGGQYQFTGLAPGVYGVEEIQPEGYFDGADHVGSAGGLLQPPDTIRQVPIGSGVHAVGYDFCELEPASLSGTVFADDNNNGRPDPGEAPIEGVTLLLLDAEGRHLGPTAVTDAAGRYRFDNLQPGQTYALAEVQPAGYFDGIDTPGTAGGTAHNPGDLISNITLAAAQHGEHYDFGELRPAHIAGTVYEDQNQNCRFDQGEPGLPGVILQLRNASGELVATTTTDDQGNYRFVDLPPGVYGVEEIQPDGYLDGCEQPGTAGGWVERNDYLLGVKLSPGAKASGYNFGELLPASISGYVFQDGQSIVLLPGEPLPDVRSLRDGQFTPDDRRLAGVVLRLGNRLGEPVLDEHGNPIVAVTNHSGYYEFRGIRPGIYTIYELHPEPYVDGNDTPGSLGGLAANPDQPAHSPLWGQLRVDPNNDAIIEIRVGSGQAATDYNFSEIQVIRLTIPPPLPPPPVPPPPPALPPMPEIPKPPSAISPLEPPVISLVYGNGMPSAFTWHLSVINGGYPRRSDPVDVPTETTSTASFDAASWWGQSLDGGQWLIADGQGTLLRQFQFGLPDGIPVVGDWNGDGVMEIAVFVDGVWFLDLNANGRWDPGDLWARLGSQRDLPVAGDWDGDGKTDIGIFGPEWTGDVRAVAREPGLPDVANPPVSKPKNLPPDPDEATSGVRVIKRTVNGTLRADVIDHVFRYGQPNDIPVAGDWNGDGVTNIGLFRAGNWFLDTDGDGRWSEGDEFVGNFGRHGDLPVVADFDGDGLSDLAVYRDGRFLIDADGDRQLTEADRVVELGRAGDVPVAGDFDGDGSAELGVYRPAAGEPAEQLTQRPGDSQTR